MARPHPDSLTGARRVLAPLLGLVGVLAGVAALVGLVFAWPAPGPAPRPLGASFLGPRPAPTAERPAQKPREAGRLIEDEQAGLGESLAAHRPGSPPQANKPQKRQTCNVPVAAHEGAVAALFLDLPSSLRGRARLLLPKPRRDAGDGAVDRDVHAPRGPPSTPAA